MSIQRLQGDCRETLATLPERSVHMVVTSPPYWALRSYLPADSPLKQYELGNEPTPELFIENLVHGVMAQVHRVLRDDGTLWCNLGDTYAGSGKGGNPEGSPHVKQSTNRGTLTASDTLLAKVIPPGLKPGDRCMMPERFALAMQEAGWWLRDVIIWHKPSPMPSPVNGWRFERCRVKVAPGTIPRHGNPGGLEARDSISVGKGEHHAQWSDCPGCDKCREHDGYVLRRGSWRTTAAHEYIYLFAKSDRYFCDAEGAKVPAATAGKPIKMGDNWDTGPGAHGKFHRNGREKGASNGAVQAPTANPRSVWRIGPEPLKAKHYAAFPSELPRRCIQAGTPDKGCCPHCGAPWARIVSREPITRERPNDRTDRHEQGNGVNSCGNTVAGVDSRTIGWKPTCRCEAHEPVPCTVLDPFGGSGTTGIVASLMGRRAILCELNPEYIEIQDQRFSDTAPLFATTKGTP